MRSSRRYGGYKKLQSSVSIRAKKVFQVQGMAADGGLTFRRQIRRALGVWSRNELVRVDLED
jgi:hypothetical protein